MIYAKWGLIAMAVMFGGLVAFVGIYERRHPCLQYSKQRVFVAELTTYVDINGGAANAGHGGISVPVTTPAHYEDEMVCMKRK